MEEQIKLALEKIKDHTEIERVQEVSGGDIITKSTYSCRNSKQPSIRVACHIIDESEWKN